MRLCLLLVLPLLAPPPSDPETSPAARWRSVRHAVQKAAEKTGVPWAMPATIQRRVFLEIPEAPGADVYARIAKEAGLTCETMEGIRLFHRPDDAELDRLSKAANGSDKRARLSAIARLGWSRDARAWPVLAKLAVDEDVEPALAAAQALRRLEGEKGLDWRLFGVSHEDPEYHPITQPVVPWQVPLGRAFSGRVPAEAVERLADSLYLPLREAAARLAPSLGSRGRALAARLSEDRSPLVGAAGKQALHAWADPRTATPPSPKKASWHLQPVDLRSAAEEIRNAKGHDAIMSGIGRRTAHVGTPEAIGVLLTYARSGASFSKNVRAPLSEFTGGPEVTAYLRESVGEKNALGPEWSLWGLSALLDGEEFATALQPLLAMEGPFLGTPPEYTAARGAGIHVVQPLIARMEKRGHWVCRSLGYIGGPDAVDAVIGRLNSPDAGVAVAAAKGLGDSSAHAAVAPLIALLRHDDRLRRHWAVLGLGRIGGPDAVRALEGVLKEEERRKDRLVRKAAAELLKEIGKLAPETRKLIEAFEEEDRVLVPEYRPRNKRFDENFPVNVQVALPEFTPKTYASYGETRVVMDWANRLMIRYGGCTGIYNNEAFAFDAGSATWFPIRAADHFEFLFNEVRPNPGCSRAMCFDTINKFVWIGPGIGAHTGPNYQTHNRSTGVTAYDAALDRFLPLDSARLPTAYPGEPDMGYVFDPAAGQVIASKSGAKGITVVDVRERKTALKKGLEGMPILDNYPPSALAYDPVDRKVMYTHPKMDWKLGFFDAVKEGYSVSELKVPGKPNIKDCGGLVYDSMNREMILVGGKGRGEMPVCRYDRKEKTWVDLQAQDIGKLRGGDGHSVYDPEHNVILGLGGGAYRYKAVPVGTKGYIGGEPAPR
jgi:HEAT repeat protein